MEDISQIGKPKPPKRDWSAIIIFSVFAFLIGMTGILVLASVYVPKAIQNTVETYTDTQQTVMPEVEYTEEFQTDVEERLDTFVQALKRENVTIAANTSTEELDLEPVGELILNEEELNALLLTDKGLRDLVRLSFSDGLLRTQMSIPLDSDVSIGPWTASMSGRYINGIAEITLGLEDSGLTIQLVSFEAGGEQVPNWLLEQLQKEIEKEGFLDSPEVREVVEQLSSIEIIGDQLILSPKTR